MMLSVCLFVAYIGPKSRTERPRKTKIGTEVVHVARDSPLSRSKVKVTGWGHIVASSRLQLVNYVILMYAVPQEDALSRNQWRRKIGGGGATD